MFTFANDGIRFTEGSWKEVLSKAKAENKLIFIDVYTSWCGPCKMMAAETFPLKEVGDVFNAHFINYKIDAEKGEGIAIAKKFDVRAFPTYLFVNGDGELVYRVVGYMEANPFLEEAKIAIREKNDAKPLVQWEKEYQNGKRDKAFLIGYLQKRALQKLPSAEIADELFPSLTKAELADKDLLRSFIYYDAAVQIVPEGKVFNYLIKNYKRLDSSGIVEYPLPILEMGISNYFKKNIIANKKEKMLPVAISAVKKVLEATDVDPAEITLEEKEYTYLYYDGTNNKAKLAPAVIDCVENGIMKMDIPGMQKSDAEDFQKFMQPYLNGEKDSLAVEDFAIEKRMAKADKMGTPSFSLGRAAHVVYNHFSDKKMLELAAAWIKLADEWKPHFTNKAIYAGILFKLGEKDKAVEMMQKASEDPYLSIVPDRRKLFLENVESFKQDKLPAGLLNRVETSKVVNAK